MADNFHIYEDIVALGQPTFTDDGSGIDWLVLSGDYGGTLAAPGAFLILSNYKYNANPPPGDFAFAFNLPTTLATVKIYGLIENAMGGAGSEVIFGSDFDNVLQGDPDDVAGGGDVLNGFAGQDTLYGMGGSDQLGGGDGNDLLFGDNSPFLQGGNIAFGDDILMGDAGNDTLFGGFGTNALYGGDNYDTADYSGFFDDFGNVSYRVEVNAATGTAQVWSTDLFSGDQYLVATDSFANVEIFTGTGGDDTFVEKAVFAINDLPYNTFQGGGGNDSYYMSSLQTAVVETAGGGYDHVYGYVAGELFANVEALTMTNGAFLLPDATGNDLDNVITGNALDNEIAARGGNDRILSAAGRDFIWGEGGSDTVYGGAEGDTMQGNEGADSLLGEAGRDWLYGNEGRDSLFGGDSADTLLGQESADRLYGGAGNDWLEGNQGADTLTGDSGADTFVYSTLLDAIPPTAGARAVERITDFTAGTDKIDLHNLATGLTFIGGQRFHAVAGEVRYNATTGVLMGDTTGDGLADFAITLTGAPILTVGDLIL